MVDAQDRRDFQGLLRLRRAQIDDLEAANQDLLSGASGARQHCERRLSGRMLTLLERLPWRDKPGGAVVDRGRMGQVRKVRRQMLEEVDHEFARLERRLLAPALRGGSR